MTQTQFQPLVHGIFDPATWTMTYVVFEKDGGSCAIIDSVLDYDPKSGQTSHDTADKVVRFVREHNLQAKWILETHAHADHLTAAPYLKQALGGQIGIGARIGDVQQVFKQVFNLEPEFKTDGSQFDVLLDAEHPIALDDVVGEIMEVHSRAIASALSEDSNKGENNKIRLYKPSIVRYSYLRFPESVLPKAMVSEIKYGAKNALLLAKVYCWLAETGETKLAKRTASLLGVDVAIVHSAVKTARKNGWMTKSQQGKSGGTFTEDGEASFKSHGLLKVYEQIVSNTGGKK
jgi:hypothetical protein